jgi:hypothetical protein
MKINGNFRILSTPSPGEILSMALDSSKFIRLCEKVNDYFDFNPAHTLIGNFLATPLTIKSR